MRTSSSIKVCELYEESAEGYAAMMDAEIDLPIYADTLGRLAERLSGIPGPVVDTSCGPGHMLARYRERYDPDRSLVGVDLSPRMVALAGTRLGAGAEAVVGDMRDLSGVEAGSGAAVLSFFAVHHVDPAGAQAAFREWSRVLRMGGQVLVAAWEGTGAIDYGGATDVVALRYTQREIIDWAQEAGFVVDRCVVEPVEGMPMAAVYLEGTKRGPSR